MFRMPIPNTQTTPPMNRISAIPPDNRLRRAGAVDTYLHHGQAQRLNTDNVIYSSLQKFHPGATIRTVPELSCDILAFGAAGQASVTAVGDGTHVDGSPNTGLRWTTYQEPASRVSGSLGSLIETVLFGRFDVHWKGQSFILYVADGRDGEVYSPHVRTNYLIAVDGASVDELVLAVGSYQAVLHEEIWVFDSSRWMKDAGLYKSIQKASWGNVILDEEMKKDIIRDVNQFFDGQKTYNRLKVPWKRGLIFHGPPGNGKTISIKAIMHMLYDRKIPAPTLYVKTLNGFTPPEYALNDIFTKARKTAPCFLVFEDLDSVVTDRVRSYFLNQVDGIASNEGILMVGSTNHLELLDPGIAKRPSRFDRKYLYPNPNYEQRVKYAQFWRNKLLADEKADDDTPVDADDNPHHVPMKIVFPEEMCEAVAKITDKFSFAYIQEAFVAALLALATGNSNSDSSEGYVVLNAPSIKGDDDLDDVALWIEFKKQVKILRDQIDPDDGSS